MDAPTSAADIVEAWFQKHFHNLGAQLDTEIYNRLYAAKEELKATLAPPVSTSDSAPA